jgi:hypothetical protein
LKEGVITEIFSGLLSIGYIKPVIASAHRNALRRHIAQGG